MITLEISRREGYVIIENNPYIPDSIYRIHNSPILVPISNDTENELRLSDDDISFEYVTSLPARKEQINYITHEELSARLQLLTENLRLLSLNYPIAKPASQSLIVANGESVEIIGRVVIPIMISKDVKHMSFRLVPKLKSTSILGTDMIKNLKMTLNYDTETWWLPGSPPTRYQMEARPHSLPKPIIENTTSDRKKGTKTSKKDGNEISENKMNHKIQNSVDNRIKSETKGIENNNKELKPKSRGKIKLKSERENSKTIVGKQPLTKKFRACSAYLYTTDSKS